MGYSPWGHKESDTTEWLTHTVLINSNVPIISQLKDTTLQSTACPSLFPPLPQLPEVIILLSFGLSTPLCVCGSSDSKPSAYNVGDPGLIPGSLLEKEMATHSSILAWKIPWTEDPGRLQSKWQNSSLWLAFSLSLNRNSYFNIGRCVSLFLYHSLFLLLSSYVVCVQVFWDPMDCSTTGSSAHGILQARILEWVAISFSRGSSPPRDQNCSSYTTGRFFTTEPPGKPLLFLSLIQDIIFYLEATPLKLIRRSIQTKVEQFLRLNYLGEAKCRLK